MRKILTLLFIVQMSNFGFSQNPNIKEFYSGCNNYFLFSDSDFVWQLASPFLIKRNITSNQTQIYSYQNSNLPNAFLKSMIKDQQGRYWIATNSGLIKLENGTFTILDTSNSAIPSNYIANLSIDTAGSIWFTCSNLHALLIKFDGNNLFSSYSFSNLVNTSSYTLDAKIDKLNTIWLLQSDTCFIRLTAGVLTKLTIPPAIGIGYLPSFFIDNSLTIYLESSGGISKYNGLAWTSIYQLPTQSPSQYLDKLFYDGQQNIWFSTYTSSTDPVTYGLHKYKIANGSLTHYAPSVNGMASYSLESMAFDKNNSLWIGYYGSLQKLTGTTWNTYYNEIAGLGGYMGIIPDYDGGLCITGYGGVFGSIGEGALNFYDGQRWKSFTQYNSSLFSDKITGIVKDKSANLWIRAESYTTGAATLFKYNGQFFTGYPDPSSFAFFGNPHSNMFIDSLDRIWISGFDKVYKFDAGVWTQFSVSSIPGLPANCNFQGMTIDKLGNVWLRVNDLNSMLGIVKFDGTTWTFFPHSASYLNGVVHITCDNQNRILLPLGPDGLHIFDGTNWTILPLTGGGINFIYDAVSDNNGKIYVAGNQQKLFSWDGSSWSNFTTATTSFHTNFICDKSNTLYFGSETNLIVYNSSPSGIQFSWDKPKVIGTVFYDGNQNKIQDGTETGMGGKKLILLPDSTSYLSGMNGDFSIPVDSGNHVLANLPNANWILTTDSSVYHIDTDTTNICCYNFGNYPAVFKDSLDAHITCFSAMRCGFDVSYSVNYRNHGTNLNTGRITLVKNDSLLFLTASPAPSNISNDTLFWNFTNLNPGEERIIYLTCKAPLTSGLEICANIKMQNYSNGNFVTLATDSFCSLVSCSFDPNDKEALPHGLYDQHYTLKNEALEYIIRFQNLGNDTAFNILIRDTLSPKLNGNSFQVIGYSHPVATTINNSGIAEFRFASIRLPHDEANELGSHGFVRYKIMPIQGLPDGTRITNSAQIYFDFNAPIFTNSVFNTLVDSLSFIGINEPGLPNNQISIYPNPVNDKLTLHIKNKEPKRYEIMDITGRIVNEGKLSEGSSTLNVGQLTPTIYFMRISGEHTNYSIKFIKQ